VDGTNEIKTRRLNPGAPISPGATAVHKITDADVADKPAFKQLARGLLAYLEDCDMFGGGASSSRRSNDAFTGSLQDAHLRYRGQAGASRAAGVLTWSLPPLRSSAGRSGGSG
jgi:hypothetical protein